MFLSTLYRFYRSPTNERQYPVINKPNDPHILGMWEESNTPGRNPCGHKESVQTPQRQYQRPRGSSANSQCNSRLWVSAQPCGRLQEQEKGTKCCRNSAAQTASLKKRDGWHYESGPFLRLSRRLGSIQNWEPIHPKGYILGRSRWGAGAQFTW